jgi:hypothetical protein
MERVFGLEEKHTGVDFYSNVKSSDVQWLWYPYIPCGKITILQGDPGEGKSTFIIHVAAILTRAGVLPDGCQVKEAATVIYQCSEDSMSDTIKPRLEAAGADCSRVAFIEEGDDALTLDDERIDQALEQTGAKLLVLDPIQAFIGRDGDMQSAVRMRKIMRRLSFMAENHNCAVVLIGHMNKGAGNNNLYRGLGSIDIAANARSVLMVSKDVQEPWKRYVFPIKVNLAPEGEPIGFGFDKEKGFFWLGKCQVNVNELMAARQTTSAKKEMAIGYLQEILAEHDIASKEIFEQMKVLGISRRTAQEAKKEAGIQAYKKGNAWYWHFDMGDSI